MHPNLAQHLPAVRELCRRFGVARLEVFGSVARAVDFDPDHSDADFLVEFGPPADLAPLGQFFGLADALRLVLDRPVDLIEAGAVRNPYLLAEINRARELVYAA
jgi:hypothetical protein